MTQTLPITEAKAQLPRLVENANKKLDEYVITIDGSPAATIISTAELEALRETLEIMSNPKLMKDIKEAEEDVKAGRVYDWEEVKKEFGWHVSDKDHKKSKKAA